MLEDNEPRQPDSQYGLTPQPFRLPTRNENIIGYILAISVAAFVLIVGLHFWNQAQAIPDEWEPPPLSDYDNDYPAPVATQEVPQTIRCPKPNGYPHNPLTVADIQYIYGSSTGRCVIND